MKKLLVLGDSIAWGQGLAEDYKASSLFRDEWRAATRGEVEVLRWAHSGADVWDDGQSGLAAAIASSPPKFRETFHVSAAAVAREPACPASAADRDRMGEIPDEKPYLLRQILDASANDPNSIDLVLFDAGINDTEVYNLVVPGKSAAAVAARARSSQARIDFAARSIVHAFPNARLIMTGYYSVVSLQTDASQLFQFTMKVVKAALEEGMSLFDLRRILPHKQLDVGLKAHELDKVEWLNPVDLVRDEAAAVCEAWTEAMHIALRAVVDGLNATWPNRAAFVDPGFGPENAVFTGPSSLLWQFHHGEPQDDKVDDRKQYCVAKDKRGFDRLVIECASMGHPNRAGAKRYADRIVAAAKRLGLFPMAPGPMVTV